MNLDLGDAVLSINLHIKGLKAVGLLFHAGAPRDSKPADRVKRGRVSPAQGKVGVRMDLKVDNSLPFTVAGQDEMNNQVPLPAGVTVVYSIDDDGVLSLVDNGDGSCVVTPVGPLDSAHLSAVVTQDGGPTLEGTTEIVVVAGDAERLALVPGTPFETTPDA